MAEDRKDVYAKLKERLDRAMETFPPQLVTDLLERQRQAQLGIKNGVPVGWLAKHSADEVAEIMTLDAWRQQFQSNIVALHAEVSELLESTPWKPWRTYSKPSDNQVENAKLEVIDAFLFLLNLWFLLGGGSEEFAVYTKVKVEENLRRQLGGY